MSSRTDRPLVSVVIPTFNRAELVKRALQSVLGQTYGNLEVLIVDDASTDNTAEVVGVIADPRIRYLRQQKNGGAATSRNIGVQSANGEFVAYLDSDDTWEPEKVARQMAAMLQRPTPSQVVCYTQAIIDDGVNRKVMPPRGKRAAEPIADYVLSDEGLIHTSTVLLPRALASIAPFNTTYRVLEDWDVFLTLERQNVEWLFVDAPLSVWYAERRAGRLSASSTTEECLMWLTDHESSFSERTKHRFMLKTILGPLIGRGERKGYALKIVLDALKNGALSPGQAATLLAKIAVPKTVKDSLKAILGRNQRRP